MVGGGGGSAGRRGGGGSAVDGQEMLRQAGVV